MPNTFTKAAITPIDTIVENRRFRAYMTGVRATDWFLENGLDYADSRAKWDAAGRVNLGTANDFNMSPSYGGVGWVAPFACKLKGFSVVGTITSGSHDWEAGLFWSDMTYEHTASNVTFTPVASVISITGNDDDMQKGTSSFDVTIAEGDLVVPAVRRDGYTTSESLYGSISFWMERIH